MSLNFSLDIGYEIADEITIHNLKDTYIRLCGDIESHENKRDTLELFQLEDLKDFRRYHKAIKKTLKYFMTYEEAKEFFDEQ